MQNRIRMVRWPPRASLAVFRDFRSSRVLPPHNTQTAGATSEYCSAQSCQAPYSYNGTCAIPPPPPPPPDGITVVSKCVRNDVVAITFDDGPFDFSAGIASAITAAGGNATFFVRVDVPFARV